MYWWGGGGCLVGSDFFFFFLITFIYTDYMLAGMASFHHEPVNLLQTFHK